MDWLLQTIQPARVDITDMYSLVLERLSPDDVIKLATLVTHTRPPQGPVGKAILSIVCNVDSDVEQAVILLFTASRPAQILAGVPVVSSLAISVAQMPLEGDPQSGPSSDRAGLVCRFSFDGQVIEVMSDEAQEASDLLSEVRRLAGIAAANKIDSPDGFGPWVERYGLVRSNPLDPSALRPVSERLTKILSSPPSSPTSARTRVPPPRRADPLKPEIAPDLPQWRKNWLAERMRENQSQYVTPSEIRIRIGSWNVNGKVSSGSLAAWLLPEGQEDPDVLVVGLQELDDDPQAYIRHNPFRQNLWCEIVQKTLEASGRAVVKVAVQQLVGLIILVFASSTVATSISNVTAAYIGTGTLGMGNKGATAVRFRFKDTYLTFVNSHLAAFQEQVEARNRDFMEISRRLALPAARQVSIPALRPPPEVGESSLFQTGHLFWFGDLNYRIDLPSSEGRALAAAGDFTSLLAADQLREQMSSGRAFPSFIEPPIAFAPTYKYDNGSVDGFDSSEKQRTPSYTDRILYLPARAADVRCESYASYPEMTMSDHKPVAASLVVTVLEASEEARFRLEQDLLRQLDALENERMPDLQVEPQKLDLSTGTNVPGVTVVVSNTRQSKADWKLVPKPGEGKVTPDWLKVSQKEGTLLPGESEQVHFALDLAAVAKAAEAESVTDVCILSVDQGRDIFLPINVDVVPNVSGH